MKHIPRKVVETKKSTHPWLNNRCMNAILRKNDSEGSAHFERDRLNCISVLGEERTKYVERTKAKLASLPRRSKQWWRICHELLHRKALISSIPTLRDGDSWLADAKGKADAFATTFAEKAKLPEETVDTLFFFCVPDLNSVISLCSGPVLLKD